MPVIHNAESGLSGTPEPAPKPGTGALMPTRMLVAVPLALLAMSATHAEQDRPVVGRSMVATRYGMVASSQPLAARAGVTILERGGEAGDPRFAANSTLQLLV